MLKDSFLKELGILDDKAETETVNSKVMEARVKFVQSVEWDLGITIASKTLTNYAEAENRFLLNKEESLFVEFIISTEYSSEIAGSGMSSHLIRRQNFASIKNNDFSIVVVKKAPFECPSDGCDEDCNCCEYPVTSYYEFLRYPTLDEIILVFKEELKKQAKDRKKEIEGMRKELLRLENFKAIQAPVFKEALEKLKNLAVLKEETKRKLSSAQVSLYRAFNDALGGSNISCPHPDNQKAFITVEIDQYDYLRAIVSEKICPENCSNDCDTCSHEPSSACRECELSFHEENREATPAEFAYAIKYEFRGKIMNSEEEFNALKAEYSKVITEKATLRTANRNTKKIRRLIGTVAN